MAKSQKGFKATNAMIDKDAMKLVETTKDGVNVYSLNSILEEWNGIEGVAFSISLNKDIEPDSVEY